MGLQQSYGRLIMKNGRPTFANGVVNRSKPHTSHDHLGYLTKVGNRNYDKRLSKANPIKKEEILLISPPDDFRPNNSRIFFPITNDTIKDERINPIRRINKPKADTGIPTTVIADSTITTTNKMINRNPTTVFLGIFS